MYSNNLGEIVLTLIQVTFPGGIQAFIEEGGIVSYASFEEDTVLMYLPSIPEAFQLTIEEINKTGKFTIKIVDSLNFEDMSSHEIVQQLRDISNDIYEKYDLPEFLYNALDPIVLRILIPKEDLPQEVVDDILSIFVSKMPRLLRGVLRVGINEYPFSNEAIIEVSDVETKNDRITEESITKLNNILSEHCDVLDIISKL